MNPDILVLDEPTNGLDEDSCDIVVSFCWLMLLPARRS